MGSSVSHPVSLAPHPVGVAAALAPKDDYRSRPCSVPLEILDVLDEKMERRTPKSPIIEAELERIFSEMHQTKDNFTWRIPKQLVIRFVGEVEAAHQYYDLKKYLKEECSFIMHDSSQEDIFDHIVKEDKKMNMFNKVGEEVIQNAVEDYIAELKAEHKVKLKFDFMMYLKGCEDVNWNSKLRLILESLNIEKFSDLSFGEIKNGLERYRSQLYFSGLEDDEASYRKRWERDYEKELDCLRKAEMTAVDHYAALNRVYALVLQKRKEGCALDWNPEVEVAKMIMSDLMYASEFLGEGPMENLLYQAKTVMVRNVPLNASKLDVKELFNLSGDIERVEMKSGDKYQTAYVTFKHPKGVDEALLLQCPSILDLPVCMKPMLRSEQREAVSAHLMSQDAKTDGSARKAEDARKLEEALWKYNALNRHYFPNY